LTHATFTHPGNRENNEDCAAALERDGCFCFCLADGLGGHGQGEVASKIFCDTFEQAFALGAQDGESFLASTFALAQEEILAEQKRRNAPLELKTTGVALTILDGKARWGWCGDSRLYVLRGNKVRTRTLDHSVPQMLALSGGIKEKQIRNHPDRNRLLRVLGVAWDTPRFELSAEDADVNHIQAFLLCTDGFWELIDEKRMGALLKKSADAQGWLDSMAAEAAQNGAGTNMDNYTAIAVMM